MIKIAIVEDDASIRTLIALYLSNEGFSVSEFHNATQALEALTTKPVDLIISDIMMPGIDGYTFCEQIRLFSNVPILMITAKREREDLIKGYGVGTDDYLVKPFDPVEMVLRVKSLLRRANISLQNEIKIGNLVLNRNSYMLKSSDKQIELKLKEFELLQFLLTNIGYIFTRDQIIERVWGYGYEGSDRTLDVHIRKIREHLEELQGNVIVKTIRGVGYGLEVRT